MSKIRKVGKIEPLKSTGPKPPPWTWKHLYSVGTIVKYEGVLWELDVTGAADMSWKYWADHEELESARRELGIKTARKFWINAGRPEI